MILKNHSATALFIIPVFVHFFKNLAGVVGLEPTTNGFGDHYSTN